MNDALLVASQPVQLNSEIAAVGFELGHLIVGFAVLRGRKDARRCWNRVG